MQKTLALVAFLTITHPVSAEGNYGGGWFAFLLLIAAIIFGVLIIIGIKYSASSNKSYARTNIFLFLLIIVVITFIMFLGN